VRQRDGAQRKPGTWLKRTACSPPASKLTQPAATRARAAELFRRALTTYPQSTRAKSRRSSASAALSSAGQTRAPASDAVALPRRKHPDGAARNEAGDLALDSQK